MAANNVLVVCRLHYINTLKQELNGTKAYEETPIDEKSVVHRHSNVIPKKFAEDVKERSWKIYRHIIQTHYWYSDGYKLCSSCS